MKKKIQREVFYFLFKHFLQKPHVLTREETIKALLSHGLSMARFGDGELGLIMKTLPPSFQAFDQGLSEKLKEAFETRDSRVLICTNNYFEEKHLNNRFGFWLKEYLFRNRKNLKTILDKEYIYGDTFVTRFYHPHLYDHTDFNYLFTTYIPLLKSLWRRRNVLIVEGQDTKLGVGNDLFSDAESIRRILCPSRNAYSKYDVIYEGVCNAYAQGDLVVLALGPTASILAVQLTLNEGFQCLDVGHIDVVYLWALNKARDKVAISHKYVAECQTDDKPIFIDYDEEQYKNQIVFSC